MKKTELHKYVNDFQVDCDSIDVKNISYFDWLLMEQSLHTVEHNIVLVYS